MSSFHALVPLDSSPLTDKAFRKALDRYNSRVTVLNIVTPIDTGMIEGAILEPDDERLEEARDRANRIVERAKSQARDVDRRIETAVETGEPADAILEFVDAHDVDQVIMGGHGEEQSGIARRVLGTVATRVVEEAPVTVTVVH